MNDRIDNPIYKQYIIAQIKDWEKEKLAVGDNKQFQCFGIIDADFVNNSKCTFVIESGITCSFKCDKENDCQLCQNIALIKEPIIDTSIDRILEMYLNQNIAHSITFQGLEPLDNLKQLLWFIYYFRKICGDNIYIWTGYTEEECQDLIYFIQHETTWENIIIKFGRFRPNQKPHFDEVLGINLASDEQYALKIS